MGRKSLVRQHRRAAERNWGNSRPLSAPTERRKLNSQQDLIFATMARMALHRPEPGAVWKASIPGNLAAVEFIPSADISLRNYQEQESSIDFETHRVLIWERREKQGEALMMILSLDRLSEMAGIGRSTWVNPSESRSL